MIIDKILNYFKPKKTNKSNFGSITFYITDSKEIDISLSLPNEYESMIECSENYAKMLVDINHGYLHKSILSKLQKFSINSKNHEDILLVDNIMFFWAVFINQYHQQTLKKIDSNDPLISPSQVFQTKN